MAAAENSGNWTSVLNDCTPRGRGYIIGEVLTPLLWDAYAQPGDDPAAGKESRDLIEKFDLQDWKRFQGSTPDQLMLGLAGHLGSRADQFVAEAMRSIEGRFTEPLLHNSRILTEEDEVVFVDLADKRFRLVRAEGQWRFDGEIYKTENASE